MSVAHILDAKGANVVTISPGRSLHEAAQSMMRHGIGAIIICGPGERVEGILSERDIMRAVAAEGPEALDHPIVQHMTAKVIFATPSDAATLIMQRMTAGRFRHMPVLRNGRLAGIISIGDLIKHRLGELESEQQALREYIAAA